MSSKLLNHTLDNLHNFDDNIKLCIKKFYIPKYIDIDVNKIYPEYRHLIPSRISTISLKKILINILRYYRRLKYNNIRNSSIFALASAYLQSIGLKQGLDNYDFDYACNRAGVLGMYDDDDNNIHSITLYDIIHDLVGSEWKKTKV